ncbi:MAG: hypothetical protein F6K41_02895 [Symploca sp. SIO3E6]|nr:hypothetical protein [Caldora sp. SIO3E6]
MTFELWILLASAFWGLVHIAADSFAFKAQAGNKYTVGPRDENLARQGVAGRLHRAQKNFMETYPIFVTCVLIVYLTESAGKLSYWGTLLYLVGRILFLPLYALGIPWIRTFSWQIATFGLVLVGVQAVVSGL